MKKLATLMLALTFAFGTVAVAFAQDAPKKEETKKKKKGSKKKEDAPKKEGGAAH
jgi:ribosomal protein L12E/L44/L45/RPP1/RPP2